MLPDAPTSERERRAGGLLRPRRLASDGALMFATTLDSAVDQCAYQIFPANCLFVSSGAPARPPVPMIDLSPRRKRSSAIIDRERRRSPLQHKQ